MTYEYVCEGCGHAWEAQQPISAQPLKDCPKCGEPRAKRQISRGVGFILKGGGWYSDLYSSSSSSGGSKSGTSGGGESPSTATGPSKDAGGAKDAGSAGAASTSTSTTKSD